MTLRFPLFSKIMLWFFLNLLLLGLILFLIFNFRFESRSSSFFRSSSRIDTVTRSFENEIVGKTMAEYDEILQKYTEQYGIEFLLFDYTGRQLGSRKTTLPPEVLEEVTRPERGPLRSKQTNPVAPDDEPQRRTPPDRSPPSVYITTRNPRLYWFVGRIFTFEEDSRQPIRSRLVAASDSFTGGGLFFDPTPFLILASVIVFSMLFWLPFVRNITNALCRMTEAAGQIAEEKFDARVPENRSDELGQLGKSINHLATRLSGFVHGQKRFLGDISHELNSPLARMQLALSILEDCADDEKRGLYVEDVKEEVVLMSKLVSELLAYSKAGIKQAEVNLQRIPLRPLVETVIGRETTNETAEIELEINEKTEVLAHPELLSRALSNVVRNAVRYAGAAGKITVSAKNVGEQVRITVADCGKGVPEAELGKLFDPFHRVESDRARQTGGTGLGLAIVKTCVEACQGKVFARNLAPSGFEVVITLQS